MGVYQTDFYAWTREQASALRRAAEMRINLPGVDLDHVAEEIEGLGGSDLRALESDLTRILEHLLKLRHSPVTEPRRGWMLSVVEHRDRVQTACRRSGSLARQVPDLLPDAWRRARKLALAGLEFDGFPAPVLPMDCPYRLEDILSDDWWPEGAR